MITGITFKCRSLVQLAIILTCCGLTIGCNLLTRPEGPTSSTATTPKKGPFGREPSKGGDPLYSPLTNSTSRDIERSLGY